MKKILLSAAMIFSLLNAGGYVEPVTPIVPKQPLVSGNFYIGGALSLVSAREASVGADFFSEKAGQDRLGNIVLLGGYNFNKYIAIEGRVGTTVAKSEFTKLTSFSLFIKPQYPINNEINIYALLGLGHVKLDKHNGSNVNVSKTSFQWGVGASYNVTNEWSVFADYTSLAHNVSGTILGSNKADVDTINVGVIYNF